MSDNNMKYPFLNLKKADERFRPEMIEAARRVINSGRYIGGEEVANLERKLTEMTRTQAAVGVGNGLDALRLTLRSMIICGMLKEGDEVMVADNTYIASVLAITDAGLSPQLVDPDEDTMCLSGKVVARNITPQTKALMPVHLYGRVAWDPEMAEIASQKHLVVIEDAAQAIGGVACTDGLFGARKAGGLGHAAAVSFYPTKNVGAVGDAGAVMTQIPELATTVRAFANYGSDKRYHNIYRGFNSRLDPIQAAMIMVKLEHEKEITADRFALAAAYNNTIDNPEVRKPMFTTTVTDCVWHQYVIRCKKREALRRFLEEHEVATDVHYPVAVHMQPCYAGIRHGNLPLSEQLASEVLSLPITPGCTSVKDASDIGRIINEFNIGY